MQIEPIATDLIGSVIHFNELGFKNSVSFAQRTLLPRVKAVIDQYHSLEVLKPFTQQTWLKILEDGGSSVYNDYMTFAQKDAAKNKLPSTREIILEAARRDLKPFVAAMEKIQTNIHNPHNIGDNVNYTFDMVSIDEGGQPVINTETIKEQYTTHITTEQQADFWQASQKFIEAAETIREKLAGSKLDLANQNWIDQGRGGLFETDREGRLSLNPLALKII